MFRHGARAALTDDVDIFGSIWKNNQLTDSGKRMHYLSGLNDRERYGSFLNT